MRLPWASASGEDAAWSLTAPFLPRTAPGASAGRGERGRLGSPQRLDQLGVERQERLGAARVELRPAAAADLLARHIHPAALAVRTVAGDGVEGVGDGED